MSSRSPLIPRRARYSAGELMLPPVTGRIPVLRELLRTARFCCLLPRYPGESFPGREIRVVFPGWLPCGGIWRWDFVKPCPAIAGHPKGLGLGKIPQVDSTTGEPPGENPVSLAINCRSTSFPITAFIALAIWLYSRLSNHATAVRLGTRITALLSVSSTRAVPASRAAVSPSGRSFFNCSKALPQVT